MLKYKDIYAYKDNFEKDAKVSSKLIYSNQSDDFVPLISIIIPTYKRTELLKEAIISAINQQECSVSYEILIVDNDNNQNEAIINYISSIETPLRYFQNDENLGMGGNWNRGITLAKGKYIAFLHDDDLLMANYLSYIKKYLNIDKYDCIIPNKKLLTEFKPSFARKIITILKSLILNILFLFRFLYRKSYIEMNYWDCYFMVGNFYSAPTCGMLFKKELLLESGGFDMDFYPSLDYAFLLRFNKEHRVIRLRKALSLYRIEANDSLKPLTQYRFYCFENSLYDHIDFKGFKKHYFAYFDKEIRYYLYRFYIVHTNIEECEDFTYMPDYKLMKFGLLCVIINAYKYIRNIEKF